MAFIRRIKKGDSVYLAKVESYRKEGKVKQRVIEYLGKEIEGKPVKRVALNEISIQKVTQYLDIYVIDLIAKELGIDKLLGSKAKPILGLIYTHLLKRVSIYKTPEWMERTEILNILKLKKLSNTDLYNSLDYLSGIDFEPIEQKISEKLMCYESSKEMIVLDITDTYFNGGKSDWKSRRGKDGKYDKLIQIALAVSFKSGFPLMHRIYEGNINNVKIFEDMINDMKVKGYEGVIIDRGMYSRKNIDNIKSYGMKSILGVRLTSRMERQIIDQINREEIFSKDCQVVLKETKVYIKGFDMWGGRLIAVYNPSFEVAKRENSIEKGTKAGKEKYMGYSLIYHNAPISDSEAVKKYFEKDVVEKSFRQLKGVLSLHPLRVSSLDHIKSHIKICYLSYCILSLIGFRVKPLEISPSKALESLNSCYKVYIEDKTSEQTWEKIVTLKTQQEHILKLLNVVYKNE